MSFDEYSQRFQESVNSSSSQPDRKEADSRSPEPPTDPRASFFTERVMRTLRAIAAHLDRLGRAARAEMEKPMQARKRIYKSTLRERTGLKFGGLRVERRLQERSDCVVEIPHVTRRGWGFERKFKRAFAAHVYKAGRQVAREEAKSDQAPRLHTKACDWDRRQEFRKMGLDVPCRCGCVLRAKVKTTTNDYWERNGLNRPERIRPGATVSFGGQDFGPAK